MNVHHKCQDKVANLCGINQKLLAEALTQVSQVRSGVGHTSCVDYRQHLFISTGNMWLSAAFRLKMHRQRD